MYSVETLSNTARNFPQSSHTDITQSLQSEWSFIQRVIMIEEGTFDSLEKKIESTFLTSLFEQPPPDRQITSQPVKHGGLGLWNPQLTTKRNYNCSKIATSHLKTALMMGKIS